MHVITHFNAVDSRRFVNTNTACNVLSDCAATYTCTTKDDMLAVSVCDHVCDHL